jgi:hypothetical protein
MAKKRFAEEFKSEAIRQVVELGNWQNKSLKQMNDFRKLNVKIQHLIYSYVLI